MLIQIRNQRAENKLVTENNPKSAQKLNGADNQINPLDSNKIVLFAKQAGKTSFSSLFTIKMAFSTQKVGHTGTLDSFADGLLVVCVGSLTRLAGKITEFDKSYKAVLSFGKQTDTLECTGRVIEEKPLPLESDFRNAVKEFTGTYMQTPPAFSAIHVDGKRASDLIRSGKDVSVPAREVTVFSAEIEDILFEDGDGESSGNLEGSCVSGGSLEKVSGENRRVRAALVNFHVSKGTYIRSLARDIGEKCSSCCHLAGLRRTTVGKFSLEDAAGFSMLEPFTISRALENEEKYFEARLAETTEEKREKKPYVPTQEELLLQQAVREKSRPMDEELSHECGFGHLTLLPESEDWFSHGGKLSSKMFTSSPFEVPEETAAVFSTTGDFKGLLQKDQNGYFKYSLVIN